MPENRFYSYQWNIGDARRNDVEGNFYNRGRDDSRYPQFSERSDHSEDISILEFLGVPEQLQDGVTNTRDLILTVRPDGSVGWQEINSVSDLAIGNPTVAWSDLTDSPGIGNDGQILSTVGSTLAWVDLPDETTIVPPTGTPAGQIPVVQPDGTVAYQEICFSDLCETPDLLGGNGTVLTVDNGNIVWANPTAPTQLAAPPGTDTGAIPVVQPDGSVSYQLPTLVSLSDTPGVLGNPGDTLTISATGTVVWLPAGAATTVQAPVGTPTGSVLVANPDGFTSFQPLNFVELGDTPAALGTADQVLSINAAGAMAWVDADSLPAIPAAPPNTPAGTVPVVQPNGTVTYEFLTFTGLSDTPPNIGSEGSILSIVGGNIRWVDPATATGNTPTTFVALSDTPTAIQPGQFLIGNTAGSALEFVTLANLATQISNTFPTNSVQTSSIAAGADQQILATVGTSVQWQDLSALSNNVANGITNGSLTPNKIAPGTEGQVLTTQSGIVTWASPGDTAATVVNSIANNSFPTNKLTPGMDGQVLVTQGSPGSVTWATLNNILPDTVDTFLELLDTPSAYTAFAGRPVVVNATATALEFGAFPTATDLAATVNFIGLADTPTTYTANRIAAVNAAGNAIEFIDPATVGSTTFVALTDTPNALGGANQLLRMNAAGTSLEFVDPGAATASTFISLSDTPNTITAANAGQVVRVNAAGTAVEFVALPTIPSAFTDLTDTPGALGTPAQMLVVNPGGTALAFQDQPTPVSTFTALTDTPAAYIANRSLQVDSAGVAVELVEIRESIALCEFLSDENIENRDPGLVFFVVPARLNGYSINSAIAHVFTPAGGTFTVGISRNGTPGVTTMGFGANATEATSSNINVSVSTGDIISLSVGSVTGAAPSGLTVTIDLLKL